MKERLSHPWFIPCAFTKGLTYGLVYSIAKILEIKIEEGRSMWSMVHMCTVKSANGNFPTKATGERKHATSSLARLALIVAQPASKGRGKVQ